MSYDSRTTDMDGGGFGGFGLDKGFVSGGSDLIREFRVTECFGDDSRSRYSSGWGSRRESRRSVGPPKKLTGLTYDQIREECLKDGHLFEDPDFEAKDSSIFYSRSPPKSFVWKRPQEILGYSGTPEFFVEGASRFDVIQGELGNCWLLAAVSCLCTVPKLAARVIPPGQNFKDRYAGIFRFNFWNYGRWVEVVVDDRLPTQNNRLVFLHSPEKNEYWSSLLEKAYAKLCGSYEALKGGSICEALVDFTGGIAEVFDLGAKAPSNLFNIMLKAHERESLMGCSIEPDPKITEQRLPNGLVKGHAYSITGVKLMDIQTSTKKEKVKMIRLRNPWGYGYEWKGAWSDKSPEWKFISEAERRSVGLVFDDDGEFWISSPDFVSNFDKMELCNLGPESLTDNSVAANKKRWEMTTHEGCWKRGLNAGGCRNYLKTFWTNPQYRFEVVDPDENDYDNRGTVILALMQKERRKKMKDGLTILTIGYVIYELRYASTNPLDMNFFKNNSIIAKSFFTNLREVAGRHKLTPGRYCVVPSTFEPNEEADYHLRLYAEKPVKSKELDEMTGIIDMRRIVPMENMPKVPAINPTPDDLKQDQQLRDAFNKLGGDDMEIDAYELQEVLNAAFLKANEFKFDGFCADTCRSLVAMKDLDRSGKLGYDEFKKLWKDLTTWKMAFKNYDKDGNGMFNSFELRQSFHDIGFTISNQTFNALVQRYSHKDGKIHFDDFIHCTARLNTMFDIFKEMSAGNPKAHFSLDQFIQTTMYS